MTPCLPRWLLRVARCWEPIDIALPAGHRLCAAPRVLPRDVVGEPWIGVPPGFPFDEIRRSIEQVTGAATEVRQRVRYNRIVESLVAAGLGIALLPRFTTRCEGLELRALAGVGATRWVVAMSRPDRAERGAVRAVLAELERIAAEVAGQMGAPGEGPGHPLTQFSGTCGEALAQAGGADDAALDGGADDVLGADDAHLAAGAGDAGVQQLAGEQG